MLVIDRSNEDEEMGGNMNVIENYKDEIGINSSGLRLALCPNKRDLQRP